MTGIQIMTGKMEEIKEHILQERKATLIDDLEKHQKDLKFRYKYHRFAFVLGLLFILVITPITYIYSQNSISIILFFYGFIFLFLPILNPVREIEIEKRDIENELDLLNISKDSIEQRAEKQFKFHQLELKRYYDQTLRQSSLIFYGGLFCLFLGFVVIGISLYFVFFSSATNVLSDKILFASLGAIGAILSNFIGIIFLKMHSETIKSLTEFHNRLVLTHHLHFGNFLIGKITDQTLREKTLAEIALNVAKQ